MLVAGLLGGLAAGSDPGVPEAGVGEGMDAARPIVGGRGGPPGVRLGVVLGGGAGGAPRPLGVVFALGHSVVATGVPLDDINGAVEGLGVRVFGGGGVAAGVSGAEAPAALLIHLPRSGSK
jgi:hypothetical protein